MALRTITLPGKSNKYTEDVKALLEATTANTDAENVPAWDLTIPTSKVDYERGEFQRAANFINKTAKVVGQEVEGDNTTLLFILVDKYAGKSKGKSATEQAAEDATEVVPAELADETPAEVPADENQTRPKPRR